MAKNKTILKIFIITYVFFTFSIHAVNSSSKKADFVFAIFATYRTRADLIDKANKLNIYSYNINYQSKIDIKNKCVQNVWIRAANKWFKLKKVPLPDVVYDFGIYKNKRKRKEKVSILKEELRSLGIPFINPEEAMMPINNKIDFSKIMIDNKITHPETKKYKKSNLKKMLAKYDVLFIKPTFGSKGYGIIIIEKVNKDFFSIKYKIQDRQKKWLYVNNKNIFKKELYAAVEEAKKQLKNANSNYFIQQGIDIYKYNNQQTDFRVNVQRGLNGVIIVTSLVMRVGGNLSQGGRPADYISVLQPLEEYNLSIENIKNEVINLSINAHLVLEKFTGKEIGDLGMDLVIDNDTKAYIIEANTKNGYPSKYVEKNPFLENLYGLPPALSLCKQSDENHENNLIEYAKYLVKKSSISKIEYLNKH